MSMTQPEHPEKLGNAMVTCLQSIRVLRMDIYNVKLLRLAGTPEDMKKGYVNRPEMKIYTSEDNLSL